MSQLLLRGIEFCCLFLLPPEHPANYLLLDKDGSVHIFIHKQAAPADVLKSFIHGLVLANLARNGKFHHAEARRWMDENYTTLISKVSIVHPRCLCSVSIFLISCVLFSSKEIISHFSCYSCTQRVTQQNAFCRIQLFGGHTGFMASWMRSLSRRNVALQRRSAQI